MREYALQFEGFCIVEVVDTSEGPEIQKVRRSQICLFDENVEHTVVLYLSDFRDATGRSLEDVIADQSVPLHQMLDEEIKHEAVERSWP